MFLTAFFFPSLPVLARRCYGTSSLCADRAPF